MHIHPNNNLAMAALGTVRNEVQEMQAKRAAEVRRKLSAPLSRLAAAGDGIAAVGARTARDESSHEQQTGNEAEFGRLFSARA